MGNFWRLSAVLLVLWASPAGAQVGPGPGGGGSGGGLSVPFGGAIGANGTPVGFKDASGNFQPLIGNTAALGPYVDTATSSYLAALINSPPNVGVNGTNAPLTGATPGGSRSGTIVGMDVNVASVGQTAVVANPCMSSVLIPVPISQATSTQILALATSKKNYICSIFTVGSDAENLSLVEGTGSVCGTGTTAIIGSTTSANGPNFAANGGFATAGGGYPIAAGTNASYNVCLLQSGTGRVAGVAMIAQQ